MRSSCKLVLLILGLFQIVIILFSLKTRDLSVNEFFRIEIPPENNQNYLCSKESNSEIDIFLETKLKNVESKNKQMFNSCKLNKTSRGELFSILEHRDSFVISLKQDDLKNLLYSKKGITMDIYCNFQSFKKSPIKWIEERKIGPLFVLKKSNNFSAEFFNDGSYDLACYGITIKNISYNFYNDLVYVLPKNFSELIKLRKESSLIVEDEIERFDDIFENPLLSDGDLYESCEQEVIGNNSKQNVFILMIDSTSIHSLKRTFPLTYKYLSSTLKNNVMFENFNTVGGSTYQNFLAGIVGLVQQANSNLNLTESEHEFLVNISSTFHDYYPFSWKDFEKIGYMSIFNEDNPVWSIFNHLRKGLKYNPTALYNYGYWSKYHQYWGKSLCKNGIPTYKSQVDMLKMLIEKLNNHENKNTPYFFYNHWVYYVHDNRILPVGLDIELKNFIEYYENKGYWDNTLLIIMSDHGFRFAHDTHLKRIEQDWPFISMRLPKQLWDTESQSNLFENRKKLSSHFDLFKTLKQFYYVNKYGIESSLERAECRKIFQKSDYRIRALRGVSFMENIPVNRSCSDAIIPNTFCLCNKKVSIDEDQLEKDTGTDMNKLIEFISNKINSVAANFNQKICELFVFKKLLSIHKVYSDVVNYELFVLFEPGQSSFQINLGIENKNKFKIIDNPLRISRYNNQSYCVTNKAHAGFCVCYKSIILNELRFEREAKTSMKDLRKSFTSYINMTTEYSCDISKFSSLKYEIQKIYSDSREFYTLKISIKNGASLSVDFTIRNETFLFQNPIISGRNFKKSCLKFKKNEYDRNCFCKG